MPKGPIPLFIGVTGHRDLLPEDVGALKELIRQFLVGVQERYPNTPLKVLSALAEGADRIVAQVALDLGIGLIVPLPLELPDYCQDFEAAVSKEEFNSLLMRAERSFIVRAPTPARAERPECYARVGAYIARHSEILLALWNGLSSEEVGGTANVVHFKLEGVPSLYAQDSEHHLLAPADTGPVYYIVTRRQSEKRTQGEPLTARYKYTLTDPEPTQGASGQVAELAAEFEKIYQRTEEFNSDSTISDGWSSKRREESRSYLLNGVASKFLDRDTLATIEVYTVADVLAQRFQSLTMRALNVLFGLVFLAVLSFEVWAHEVWSAPAPLVLYISLILVAYCVHPIAKEGRYQEKYLDYRALAEGLRVQVYWRIAGLSDGVSEHYMRHQQDELEWIRNAIRHFEPPPDINEPPEEERLKVVIASWVKSQRDYFERAINRESTKLQSAERRTKWLVPIGLLAAIGVCLLALRAGSVELLRQWKPYMVLSMALPPLGAALIHGYAEKRALSSHVKRYRRVLFVYKNAQEQLLGAVDKDDWQRTRNLLRELGSEALEENGDWVILHRERPLEVPHVS